MSKEARLGLRLGGLTFLGLEIIGCLVFVALTAAGTI